MRILHTADWHLGKQLHGVSFIEDQAYVLDDFVRLAVEESPDCIIIAGDIYDRSIPPTDAVNLLDETLNRLVADYGGPIVIIAGNHDSPDRLGFASTPLARSGIFLSGRYSASADPLVLDDEFGKVAICCIPYLEPAVARQELGSPDLRTHEDAMRAACALLASQIEGKRSVLVAHAFVAGGEESDSERPLSIGGSSLVPAEVFHAFSYVALGHLHRPQTMYAGEGENRVPVRYSGSLLKYSFSEVEHKKSHTVIELAADGAVTYEASPIVPKRDMRAVKGDFKDLLQGQIEGSPDDYLVIELTNSDPILDVMSRLRAIYPNVLHITKPQREVEESEGYTPSMRKLGDLELFKSFYEYATGEVLDERQEVFLGETLEELSSSERGE